MSWIVVLFDKEAVQSLVVSVGEGKNMNINMWETPDNFTRTELGITVLIQLLVLGNIVDLSDNEECVLCSEYVLLLYLNL